DLIAGRYFPQSYFGMDAQLWRDGPADLFHHLDAEQLCKIEALRLLTLDNSVILYAGDENSRPEVTAFMSALNGMADRHQIGILLSAHPSKSYDGSASRVSSGTTAWVWASRSVLELKRESDKAPPSLTA